MVWTTKRPRSEREAMEKIMNKNKETILKDSKVMGPKGKIYKNK